MIAYLLISLSFHVHGAIEGEFCLPQTSPFECANAGYACRWSVSSLNRGCVYHAYTQQDKDLLPYCNKIVTDGNDCFPPGFLPDDYYLCSPPTHDVAEICALYGLIISEGETCCVPGPILKYCENAKSLSIGLCDYISEHTDWKWGEGSCIYEEDTMSCKTQKKEYCVDPTNSNIHIECSHTSICYESEGICLRGNAYSACNIDLDDVGYKDLLDPLKQCPSCCDAKCHIVAFSPNDPDLEDEEKDLIRAICIYFTGVNKDRGGLAQGCCIPRLNLTCRKLVPLLLDLAKGNQTLALFGANKLLETTCLPEELLPPLCVRDLEKRVESELPIPVKCEDVKNGVCQRDDLSTCRYLPEYEESCGFSDDVKECDPKCLRISRDWGASTSDGHRGREDTMYDLCRLFVEYPSRYDGCCLPHIDGDCQTLADFIISRHTDKPIARGFVDYMTSKILDKECHSVDPGDDATKSVPPFFRTMQAQALLITSALMLHLLVSI